MRRITVNLAPADLRKEGPSDDLPMAVALLAASEQQREPWSRRPPHALSASIYRNRSRSSTVPINRKPSVRIIPSNSWRFSPSHRLAFSAIHRRPSSLSARCASFR